MQIYSESSILFTSQSERKSRHQLGSYNVSRREFSPVDSPDIASIQQKK